MTSMITKKYSHSIDIFPSSHLKNQKMEIEKNVKTMTRGLHHQHQQEAEIAHRLKNDD
jgi:hypothetical protein